MPAVHDESAFGEILRAGTLGLGESYMTGKWDCEQLDRFFERLLGHRMDRLLWIHPATLKSLLNGRLVDGASPEHAGEIGERHYDLGNDLFEEMLGPSMAYSCGYWNHREDLTEAQL